MVPESSGGGTVERERCRIAYSVQGSGAPVVMIQGVGVAGCGWRPQLEALRGDYSLCTFDHRGVGDSTGVPSTIEEMAADSIAVMDALGWTAAHVVGHSMGSSVAVALALDAPKRVLSLGLFCAVDHGRAIFGLSPRAIWRQLRTRFGSAEARRRAFFRLVSPTALAGAHDVDVERLERAFGRRLNEFPAVALRQVRALGRFDPRAGLPRLASIPSLVVSAEEDIVCPPAAGARLAAAMEAAFECVPGAHAIPVQNPDAVNDRLRSLWAAI